MFRKLILTALIMAWGLSGAVSAADFTWVGGSSSSWNDQNNWDVLGVPSNPVPATGYPGDNVYINSVTTNTCNVNATGAVYMALYVQNDGFMTISAGTDGTVTGGAWGAAGNGSSYNMISDGTVNVSGSWDMAQNLYIAHTDTAGSYGLLNILPTGVVRTKGVLTIAGRRGAGEMNIWGKYYLVQGARLDYLPVQSMLPYTETVHIYQGGQWVWTGDHITNTTDSWNNLPWWVANGHLVSGTPGYGVQYSYDLTNNVTNITVARYLKAYNPVYSSPAVVNDTVNVNVIPIPAPATSGTVNLGWTKPIQSGVGEANSVQSSVYFGTDNPPMTKIAGPILTNSVAGVPIAKYNNYYWQVNSYDPNSNVTTPGDVWSFNTQNEAPVASSTSPARTWLVGGVANITLSATATDDGYPAPTTLTYTWTQTDTTKDILASAYVGQNVPLYFGTAFGATVTQYAPVTRNFQVVCSDGAVTGPAYAVAVIVYTNACLAGQAATSVTTGDIYPAAVTSGTTTVVGDCLIDFKDFALLASTWNTCKTTDKICPF